MDLEAQRIAAGEQAAQLAQDGMVIGYGTGRAATAAPPARLIIVVEEMKLVERLGATRGIPIEVLAFGWTGTLQRIAELMPGAARRDGPLSDNGGVLVDAPLPAGADLREVARALKAIAGLVEHGLFLDFAPTVIVGGPSGARLFSGG